MPRATECSCAVDGRRALGALSNAQQEGICPSVPRAMHIISRSLGSLWVDNIDVGPCAIAALASRSHLIMFLPESPGALVQPPEAAQVYTFTRLSLSKFNDNQTVYTVDWFIIPYTALNVAHVFV